MYISENSKGPPGGGAARPGGGRSGRALSLGRVQQEAAAAAAAGLVLLQQLRDFLVVRVGVQRLVVVVVLLLVLRSPLEPLGLRVLLLLGRGHLRRVLLPPLGPAVLEPDLWPETGKERGDNGGRNLTRVDPSRTTSPASRRRSCGPLTASHPPSETSLVWAVKCSLHRPEFLRVTGSNELTAVAIAMVTQEY